MRARPLGWESALMARPRSLAYALLFGVAFLRPVAAAASDWRWAVTPYAWLVGVDVGVAVDDREVAQGSADVTDLLSRVQFAGQLNVQGMHGRHGFLVDLTYANFGSDARRELLGPASSTLVAKGDMRETLLDVAGLYDPDGESGGLAVLYGARVLAVTERIDLRLDTPAGTALEKRYELGGPIYEALLGVRYAGAFSERWAWNVKADASTGGKESTWSALAGAGYRFGKAGNKTLLAGYRYMQMRTKDTDGSAEVRTTVSLSGPYIALRFGG